MKKSVATAIAILGVNAAMCQQRPPQPLPAGTAQFAGNLEVRYTPGFEARCTKVAYERANGEPRGSETTSDEVWAVYETAPRRAKISLARDGFRMVMGLNESRTGLSSPTIELESDVPHSPEEMKIANDVIAKFGESFYKNIKFPTTMRMGSDRFPSSFCEIFPGGRTISKTGRSSVAIGVSPVRGRDAIVFAGEGTMTCAFAGMKSFSSRFQGWEAIDIQSGLPSDSSIFIESIGETGRPVGDTTEDKKCIIASTNSTSSPPPVGAVVEKSAEQRLIELKSLFDKGLISKEEYEHKRGGILKGL